MKKALSIILAVIMIISVLPLTAFAETHIDLYDPATGWNYRYYFARSVARLINYSGGPADMVVVPARIGGVPVEGFTDLDSERIPTGVENLSFELQVGEIPARFSKANYTLQSVTLPEGLLSIGSEAFSGCRNLTSVSLPSSLQTIGDGAFFTCMNLTEISLPSSLRTIGATAFFYCSELTSVAFPSSMRSIGNNAFEDCYALQTVTVADGLQSIGDAAFLCCTSLTSIALPNTVYHIGKEAFRGCTSLTSADLPDNLMVISSYMFYWCTNLTTIDFPSSVYSIQDWAFYHCEKLDNITLPSRLRYLQDAAFSDCSSLSSITIPGSVNNIGSYAFYHCSKLTNIVLEYGVRTIGEHEAASGDYLNDGYSFSGCNNDNLVITIPSSVITVYGYSFNFQNGKAKKYIDGEKRFLDRIDFGNSTDKSNFHYRVPVSFETEHGTAPATVYPYNESSITLPSITAQGYSFIKWKDTINTFTVPNEPITLFALWQTNNNRIIFFSSKGETPAMQVVPSGNTASEPAGQLVGNEYLEGWYKYSDLSGGKYDFSETVLNDIHLYAKWVAAPSVTVNITGAGTGNQVVFRDRTDSSVVFATVTQPTATVNIPADAVMEITAASGLSYSGSIQAEIPAGSGTYYTKITDIIDGQPSYSVDYGDSTTVNVTFSSTPTVSVNITADGDLNADDLWTLTDGYSNSYTSGSYVNVPQGGMASTNDELTLTLTYPTNYGCEGTIINGDNIINVYDGKAVTIALPNGTFGRQRQIVTSFLPTGSVTLNLHFYSRNDYTTLYFENSSSDYFTQKYLKTETSFTLPENTFSNSHGIFNSWNTSSDGTGDSYSPDDVIALPSADTEYYAIWDDAYYMSFNKNSGTGSMSRLYCLTTDPELTVPECEYTRNGYAFTGWNTKANGSGVGYQPNDSVTLSDDIILYAQWTQAYTVYLYENAGDSNYIRQEIPRGNSENIKANPYTRDGYIFLGWNTSADGTGTAYADSVLITPTGTLRLYAQWRSVDTYINLYDDATVKIDRDDGFIYNLTCAMRMPHLLCQFSNNHEQIKILDKDGNTLGFSDYIGTGTIIRLVDANDDTVVLDELTVVVYGDINGDSAVDAFDLFECDKAVNNISMLSGAYLEATDFNSDGSVDSLADYAVLYGALIGTEIDQSVKH